MLTKERRRIFRDDLKLCDCGNSNVFVAWKWVHGCPNVRHYAVVCDKCRPAYQWRRTENRAVEAWNMEGLSDETDQRN